MFAVWHHRETTTIFDVIQRLDENSFYIANQLSDFDQMRYPRANDKQKIITRIALFVQCVWISAICVHQCGILVNFRRIKRGRKYIEVRRNEKKNCVNYNEFVYLNVFSLLKFHNYSLLKGQYAFRLISNWVVRYIPIVIRFLQKFLYQIDFIYRRHGILSFIKAHNHTRHIIEAWYRS